MKNKVVVTARSFGNSCSEAYEYLKEHDCEVVKIDAADLLDEIEDADAVIAGLEEYGAELVSRAGKLKVISRYGVGYDKIDLKAVHQKGIKVTITPGANGDSVADLAVALMLDVARNIAVMDRAMKAADQVRPAGAELWQKTLGVIGTGRIGQGVARRCRGFDMRVLCYDMYQDHDFEKQCGATYVSMEELVRESDFITLHVPFTAETENMFDEKLFGQMKKTAIIVNTARGGLINEEALYLALKEGRIRGAGLDATVEEPPYGSPLLSLDNCIITPHAGAATVEASNKMSLLAAQNVVDILNNRDCPYIVGWTS